MFKDFLVFTGLIRLNGWVKDKYFYLALSLGPLFYLCLFLFIPPHLKIEPTASFFATQFFLVAFPEELFFRGVLLPIFKTHLPHSWKGWSLANVFTAFIFACLHLFTHPLFWALGTFFPALIFGYFREKHQSLWPSIVLHFFYNISYFIWLR